jgi:hypothetical protein
MEYCHDNDLGLLDAEVDSEGKARHQRTACIAMNYRVTQRLFGNELESRKCFVQEFVPETFALLLVP